MKRSRQDCTPNGQVVTRADFSDRAESDFRRIWWEGAERWGPAQADAYTDELYTMVLLLAETPEIVRLRTELTPPVRVFPFRSHVIVYREKAKGEIEVIRLLHGRQDVLKALSR